MIEDHRIVFIGCGKSKRRGKHKACDLYVGVYFRTYLTFARCLVEDDRIFILSAKYGVLGLDQVIESYDFKLSELNREEMVEWKRRVLRFMNQWIKRGFRIEFVCGRIYSDGLPGENLLPRVGIGKQMRYMCWQIKMKKGLFNGSVPSDKAF